MKTLVFGAGPLGSLYACILHKAGNDVTILARGEVAMMMHINATTDEVIELGNEIKTVTNQTSVKTPNLDKLISCIL
jgi:ketopantoate reductase